MEQPQQIKLDFNGQIRMIPSTKNFSDLKDTVTALFKFESGFLKLTYLDDEEETILVTNDQDLAVMFAIFGKKTPKLFVEYSGP